MGSSHLRLEIDSLRPGCPRWLAQSQAPLLHLVRGWKMVAVHGKNVGKSWKIMENHGQMWKIDMETCGKNLKQTT